MSRKVWGIEVGDEHHMVELDYNRLTLSGRVTVDGRFLSRWGWSLASKEIPFEVGGKKAVLRFTVNHLSRNKQELYVDGDLMKESK